MALKVFKKLCCSDRRSGGRLHRPKATPLPVGKVLLVFAVLFVNQFGSLMIFPFLPFMVHDFFPELSREELGQKAGYLGSAFFLGNFMGALFWGWVSDIIGRRPVMLLGLCGTISMELLFGFSQNFGWAVAARFLWGMLNGNIGVGKTYMSEICDDTNQAKGFSAIGTGGGLGRLTGSVAGGFLAQPASKYAVFQTAFFCQFPYLLPCLVGVGIGMLTLIAAFLFLDETLHTKRKNRGENSGESEKESSSDSGIELSRSTQAGAEEEDAEVSTSLVMMESDIDSESDAGALSFDESANSDTELLVNARTVNKRRTGQLREWAVSWSPAVVARQSRMRASSCWTHCGSCMTSCLNCTPRQAGLYVSYKLRQLLLKLKEMAKLMIDRRVFLSISLYALLGMVTVMVTEAFPLLMVTGHNGGGYNLDTNEIGVVFMCTGTIQIVWQLLIYPRVVKWTGYRRALQFSTVVFVISCICIPFSNQITGPIGGTDAVSTSQNASLFSGSGSGSGWDLSLIQNVTQELNTTLNSTDYCNNVLGDVRGVNENSIKRVPIIVWLVLLTFVLFMVMSRISGFISLMVLIGNSSLPSTRGTVNGISQSLVAIARSMGPLVGAMVFAWSESNGLGWPLNYHFVFDMSAVFGVFIIVISLLLPKSSEKKRETTEQMAPESPQQGNDRTDATRVIPAEKQRDI